VSQNCSTGSHRSVAHAACCVLRRMRTTMCLKYSKAELVWGHLLYCARVLRCADDILFDDATSLPHWAAESPPVSPTALEGAEALLMALRLQVLVNWSPSLRHKHVAGGCDAHSPTLFVLTRISYLWCTGKESPEEHTVHEGSEACRRVPGHCGLY
jgi:hypothetical protein